MVKKEAADRTRQKKQSDSSQGTPAKAGRKEYYTYSPVKKKAKARQKL